MTALPGSGSGSTSDPTNQIRQAVDQNQGQVIAQMVGGLAVGQLTVYLSQITTQTVELAKPLELGQNPYQGLLTFRETDGDRFFGRSTQIEQLWQRFQQLHDDRATVRVLPIYGPSGSGKSSLARAGLIPALGKRPLAGQDHGRVVVLTPGNHPLEALATVLARIATHDPMPVTKTREFKQELLQPNSHKELDGLRRIADVFPDISLSPLIVLVDQFEEIYTLCTDATERHAFVENLLCAASDRAQRVSIILTLRSDFLGATQKHPRLNQLFSSQGFLVPIMQPEELAIAISEPAKRAGHTLDKATVQWLIEETQEREAALPLLQFALTQIWEGLRNGVEPADTLQQIGGVGGALASEAKRLYHSLTAKQQDIARCIFLALVQVNEDNKSTRRRAAISELITGDGSEILVRDVIDRFARPGVWILVTSCNEQQIEMLEVAHEALIRNWEELQEWLKEHWETLRQKRRIEQVAIEWRDQKKSKDYLLQGRSLRDARDFLQAHKNNSETGLSSLATEFVQASVRKQRRDYLKLTGISLILPALGTLFFIHFGIVYFANVTLYKSGCQQDFTASFLIQYLSAHGHNSKLRKVQLCSEVLNGIKLKRKAQLNDADFRGAKLIEAQLQEANLSDADFQGAILIGIQLQNTNLKDSNLTEVDLSNANLENAYLADANLAKAQLSHANLRGAYLVGANLEGAILNQAILVGADLRQSNLIEAQIEFARICGTKLPSSIHVGENRDC